MIQIKIEDKENQLLFNCDFQDYGHVIWLLEMSVKNGYDTYVRRLGEDD